jgi:hypothetical protein
MPLPGCCMSVDTLMLNYGATNVASTQKDQPLLSLKRRPNFKLHECLGMNKNLAMGFDKTQNKE